LAWWLLASRRGGAFGFAGASARWDLTDVGPSGSSSSVLMKTIGLIGGMSWESTLHYYSLINEGVRARLGGLHSAKLILHSVDFAPIAQMQAEDRWADAARLLEEAAASVERGGADFLVLCTNTMHRVAGEIAAAVSIPLLHIADVTADAVKRRGIRRVGLLGTAFTMEQPFYRDRLERSHGLAVVTPDAADRALVHRVIYEELCRGQRVDSSRAALRRIAADLVEDGAEGVILGCTEVMMLLGQPDVPAPIFDTTALHAAAAVDRALS
jgi:aspartate racemase